MIHLTTVDGTPICVKDITETTEFKKLSFKFPSRSLDVSYAIYSIRTGVDLKSYTRRVWVGKTWLNYEKKMLYLAKRLSEYEIGLQPILVPFFKYNEEWVLDNPVRIMKGKP